MCCVVCVCVCVVLRCVCVLCVCVCARAVACVCACVLCECVLCVCVCVCVQCVCVCVCVCVLEGVRGQTLSCLNIILEKLRTCQGTNRNPNFDFSVTISAGRILNFASNTDRNFDFYWEKSQSGSSLKWIQIFTNNIFGRTS